MYYILFLLHSHYTFRSLRAIFRWFIYTSYFIRSYFTTTDPLFVLWIISCTYFYPYIFFIDFSMLSACMWWICLLIILLHYLNISHFTLKLIQIHIIKVTYCVTIHLHSTYCSLYNQVEEDDMSGSCSTNGEKGNAYRLLVGKAVGKRPLRRPRRRWMDNIRMNLGEVGWGDINWIGLAQDRNRWRALVNSVLNLRVPWYAGKLSSVVASSGLSGSAQLHIVS
jgi:hypothetical protein